MKAHRNEEETTSKVVNKNVVVNDDSTMEPRVDRLIAKSNINQNSPSTPNRDNSQNYGRPPFQSGQRSRGGYPNNPSQRYPQGDIRQNLRGPKASAVGPFGKLMVQDLSNALNVEGGVIQNDMSIPVKLHWGGWYRNLPPSQWTGDQKVLPPTTCLLSNRCESISGGQKIP